MLKCLKTTAFAAVLAVPAFAEQHSAPTADMVVATVNGTEITLGHMIMIRTALPQQLQELPDDVLWDGIMNQIIQQTALAQAGPDALTQRVELALQNEERALRAAEQAERIMETAVSEAAITAAYAETYEGDDRGVEFNASHILLDTEAEAQDIATRARAGEDFAELARAHSTGPSGPNGGLLGWFGAGMMVPPFEAAVRDLGTGEISDPVQTQFGWHVIKLNETRVAEAPPLENVRDDLAEKVRTGALDAALSELTDAAEVTSVSKEEIDTSILKNLDLIGQ